LLADRGGILDAIQNEYLGAAEQNRLIRRGLHIAEELETLAPDQLRGTLMALLSRIDIKPDRVEINIPRSRLVALLAAQAIDLTTQEGQTDSDSSDILTLTLMARLQRVGREMRMLVENTDDQTAADPGLLRIVARAHEIQERLMQNTDLTVHVIASPGTSVRKLCLPTLTSSHASARYHHRSRQRQESATTHRQEADATDTANTGRLG